MDTPADKLTQQTEEAERLLKEQLDAENPDQTTAPDGQPDNPRQGDEGGAEGDGGSFSDFATQFEPPAGDGKGDEQADDELRRLREENARFRNKEKSAAGRLKKAAEEDDTEKRGLREENERLRKQNGELLAQGKSGADRFLTDEERQSLDEPVRKVIGKTAEGIAREEISKVGARLDEQEAILAEIRESGKASARAHFQRELEAAVPDIGTLTVKNPKFVAFMKEKEPLTGRTYHELAAAALTANDSRLTIEIISRYRQSVGEPPHRDPNVLAQQRPGSFKAAKQPPDEAGGKTYTVQELIEAENRLLRNPALERDAAFSALLGDMRKAYGEGRVS